MPSSHESMPAPLQPNIQDVFLNCARRERLAVPIRLMDGTDVEGRIKHFDRFALILEHDDGDQMIFKHAIAMIRSPRSVSNFFSTHEAGVAVGHPTVRRRVIVLVLDSLGVGELPDAARYGDEGSDTLGNIARQVPMRLPAPARARPRPGRAIAGGRPSAGATGRVRPDGRALAGQGFGHRALGDDRARPRSRVSAFPDGFPRA